jgi:HEAT repeat protein
MNLDAEHNEGREPTFSGMHNRIEDLIGQLASEDVPIHAAAAQELIDLGGAAAVALSRVCNAPSAFSHRAGDTLTKIGPEAVEPLVRVLKTGDCDGQVHAIVGLTLLKEPAPLQPLVDALESPFAEVRKAAVSALRMLRDRKAVEPLIRHLQDDDIEVAASAAWTLGWIGDRRAVGPLLLALESRNWRLRAAAASGLGDIGDEHTLDAVRSHLLDPKTKVRKAVKLALTQFHFRKLAQP